MATKKKTEELEKQEDTEATQDSATKSNAETAKNSVGADNLETDTDIDRTDTDNDTDFTPQDVAPERHIFSVAELALHYRVPSWQLAALLKHMDIEDDKFLTRDEFVKGLERLTKRKMGTR